VYLVNHDPSVKRQWTAVTAWITAYFRDTE